jgi:hypothetical protein
MGIPSVYSTAMKANAFGIHGAAALFLALASAPGCASRIGASGVAPSQYAAMSCIDLENAIGDNAKSISTTAISRAKVSQWNLPIWAPGGARTVSKVQERQTAKIEHLQGEQAAMVDVRNRRCI